MPATSALGKPCTGACGRSWRSDREVPHTSSPRSACPGGTSPPATLPPTRAPFAVATALGQPGLHAGLGPAEAGSLPPPAAAPGAADAACGRRRLPMGRRGLPWLPDLAPLGCPLGTMGRRVSGGRPTSGSRPRRRSAGAPRGRRPKPLLPVPSSILHWTSPCPRSTVPHGCPGAALGRALTSLHRRSGRVPYRSPWCGRPPPSIGSPRRASAGAARLAWLAHSGHRWRTGERSTGAGSPWCRGPASWCGGGTRRSPPSPWSTGSHALP